MISIPFADGVQGWMDGLNSKVDEIFGEEVEHMFKINAEDYKLNRACLLYTSRCV